MASNINTFYSEERVKFVKFIRKNLKDEDFITSCLWKTTPSQMIIKIDYKIKNDRTEKKVEQFLMEISSNQSVFGELLSIGFTPCFLKIKKSETEIHHVFKKKVVDDHPHGELKPFMSIGGWQTFAHDEAGRKWVANFGEPYKLFKEETHKVVYKKF